MGLYYTLFIGRKLNEDELKQFFKKKDRVDGEDYLIDGMPVMEFANIDQYYVCQHFITQFGDENPPFDTIDYTKFPNPFDKRFSLVIETEYY